MSDFLAAYVDFIKWTLRTLPENDHDHSAGHIKKAAKEFKDDSDALASQYSILTSKNALGHPSPYIQ